MTVETDAREFGRHFNQGGWRLGLLVARNVYVSEDERGRSDLEASKVGKVTANQFADEAGVSARTVQLYHRAWELAADDDKCQHAAQLSPGDEDQNINFEEDYEDERDEWLVYYRKARGSKAEKQQRDQRRSGPRATSRIPQARLEVAVKSIRGIDLADTEDLPIRAHVRQFIRRQARP